MKLIQGDCLEKMKNIPSGSVDMICCDPPYGTTACKWDSIMPLEPMWEQLNRVIKDNGAIVLFASQPFTSILVSSNLKMFKYSWVWNKVTARGHIVAKHRPLQQTEDILVFGNSKHNYYPIMIDRPKSKWKKSKEFKKTDIINSKGETEYKIYKTWFPKNLLEFSNANASNEKPLHPTQKPLDLIEYMIKTYTNEGETVLDFTMGSGTTGVACKNLNRNFIGIELDEEYFKIAEDRIKNYQVQPDLGF